MTDSKPRVQRSRWALPSVVNPPGRRCFLVTVPDEPMHIAAFRGALYELAKPYAWGNDAAHTALNVAALWAGLWADIQEIDCSMATVQIRASESGCGIEYSTDGGFNWTPVDLSECIASIANDNILQAIQDGVLQQPGGQPGPAAPPSAGSCKSYHVIMQANEKWKIPSPVSGGDTITITNARGGWTDGALFWYCWNGEAYVLGVCGGAAAFEPTDPLQAGNHMMLIGAYDTTTPQYFDARNPFTIPAGVSQQEAWIQANDDPLYDNSGQVEFDLEICSYNGWCLEWDFTASDGGWTGAVEDGNTLAVYSSGAGWGAGHANYNEIIKDLGGAIYSITDLDIWRSFETSTGRNYWRLLDTPTHYLYNNTDSSTPTTEGSLFHYHKHFATQIDGVRYLEAFGDRSPGTSSYVVKYRVRGVGTPPAGASNC